VGGNEMGMGNKLKIHGDIGSVWVSDLEGNCDLYI